MGNRAVIAMANNTHVGIYVHWNGGYDSIKAFTQYCKLRGFESSSDYGLARLTQIIANYFGGTYSIGVQDLGPFSDPGDNGIYLIDGDWTFRQYVENQYVENPYHEYFDGDPKHPTLEEFLISIDEAQPASEQLGADFIRSESIGVDEIKPGMTVFVFDDICGKWEKRKVIGLGKDETINGRNVLDVPYTDKYKPDNPNAYLWEDEYRIVK